MSAPLLPLFSLLNPHTFDEAMHAALLGSPLPAGSSNFVSLDGSATDLDRIGARSSTTLE